MAPPLKAMVARFHFTRARNLRVSDAVFALGPGDVIRLFFSCRHTPQLVRDLLRDHGLTGTGEWVNPSGEEGVFLGHKRLASYSNSLSRRD